MEQYHFFETTIITKELESLLTFLTIKGHQLVEMMLILKQHPNCGYYNSKPFFVN